jgi:hypothetical protein
MGKMKVIKEVHQDPTTIDKRWLSVTFEPVNTFEIPISLSVINYGRLSGYSWIL